jgi:hypothetical protein
MVMKHPLAGLAAAAILVLASSMAGLADQAEPPPGATGNLSRLEPAPKEELVCHYEKPTGSRMRIKVCRTAAQIQADEEDKRRALDDARARSRQPVGSGD